MDRTQFLQTHYPVLTFQLFMKHDHSTKYVPQQMQCKGCHDGECCRFVGHGFSRRVWLIDLGGPVRMEYAKYLCNTHNTQLTVFDSDVQPSIDLDIAAPTKWVLKRNNMFFTADFLWFLVCEWHAHHSVDPVVSSIHSHWTGLWKHCLSVNASVHTGFSSDIPYWQEGHGLNMFTERRTIIELIGDIFNTFFSSELLCMTSCTCGCSFAREWV